MTKTEQLIDLLKSGRKLPSEVRAAIPRLNIKQINTEIKRGTIKMTDGFFHLPELSDEVNARLEALEQRMTNYEKQQAK